MDDEVKKETTFTDVALEIAESTDSDVILFNGPVTYPNDLKLNNFCNGIQRRKNVHLILLTYGGDAKVAYRIGRCLQRKYERVTIQIPSYCKSAGTLITISANEIVMSDNAELGPLDVQMLKPDELGERDSGLTITEALNSLQVEAFSHFEHYFLSVRTKSGLQITTKSSLDIAQKLVVGLFQPIYGQIDPMRVGEVARLMQIAIAYGKRLNRKPQNLVEDALVSLAGGYPAHDFAIDVEETAELFKNVRPPTDIEERLIELLGNWARSVITEQNDAKIGSLLPKPQEEGDEPNPTEKANGEDQDSDQRNSSGKHTASRVTIKTAGTDEITETSNGKSITSVDRL